MTRKYFPNETLEAPAKVETSGDIRASFEKLVPELEDALRKVDPTAYATACLARSRVLNLYIDRTKPWTIAKSATGNSPEALAAKAQLHEVLYTLLEGIRWIATALIPVLPFGMPEVFRQLGRPVPAELGSLRSLKWADGGYQPLEPKAIYPRLELPKE
jgi:methionyl-tRNA synthetase